MKTSKTSLLLAALLIGTLQTHSQIIAFDNASDSVYDDGWQTGDNGGFGLGAWTIFAGQTLVTSSSNNGNPPPSGDIDTAGRSWGIHSAGPGNSVGRSLNADLQVGQKLLIDVDFGHSVAQVFRLRDGEQAVFAFLTAGQTYRVSGATSQDTGIPLTFDGIHLEFTLITPSTISVAITPNGGSTSTFSDDLSSQGNAVNGIGFNTSSDTSPANDLFVNSIAVVVPEPASYATVTGILLVAGLAWRRLSRHRQS